MPTLQLELSPRPSGADLDALRAALAPYGAVYDAGATRFGLAEVILSISFVSDVIQGADVLFDWLRPKGNRAVIRLSDGRALTLEATTDPDAFLRQLKAALREL